MNLIIEQRDLFTVPDDYYLCHCVSADFALGAGIAKRFAELGVKNELKAYAALANESMWHGKGYCILTTAPKPHGTFNLVTKQNYWHKPTLGTMRQALADMANDDWLYESKAKIAMPKIGCGLDKLKWDDVQQIIQDIFADTNIEILVCDWR